MPLVRTFLKFWKNWSKPPDGLSEFGWKLMFAEERHATLKNQRLVTILIVTMVPTYSILDYFAYPEHFKTFAALRILCTLLAALAYSLSVTRWARTNYRIFTVALPLIPAFFISLMVFISGDPGTPYYAGLSLVIVAVGFVFHWTYREALISIICIWLMFFCAAAPLALKGMDQRLAAHFINNCFFLLAKGIVIVSGCFVHFRFRVNEYMLRDRSRFQKMKLRSQRVELQEALQELKETEGQLIQSEKMVSLGELSAGVIHEIGNPLNYSNQALFLLRRLVRKDNPDPNVMEAIDDIQDSVDRMKDIVSELREFSHKSSEVRIEFSVREAIDVACRMLGKEISDSETTLTIEVPADIRVEGVKNQITQVFINLIQNAIQAMDAADIQRRKLIDISAYKNDGQVEVEIRDSGPGIPEDIRNRIFDPFFTTKEVGEGTGLGLSICFRIVEAHGGSMRIKSEPNEFTSFVVSFPMSVRTGNRHHQKPNVTTAKNGAAIH